MPKRNDKTRRPQVQPFIIAVGRDLTEYAYVRVFAADSNEAESVVNEMLERDQLSMLEYTPGDDRESPYTADFSDDDGTNVDLTIRNGQVVQSPRFKLVCPHCNYDGKEPSENGGTFRLLSDTTIYREIVKLQRPKKGEPQTLIVEGFSDKYDEDPEKNDRIECRSCLEEFPLPKSLPVNYV